MDEETGSQRENMIWPQHTASAEIPNADLSNFKLGTISTISTTYLPEPAASKSFPSPTLVLKITPLEWYSCGVALASKNSLSTR